MRIQPFAQSAMVDAHQADVVLFRVDNRIKINVLKRLLGYSARTELTLQELELEFDTIVKTLKGSNHG